MVLNPRPGLGSLVPPISASSIDIDPPARSAVVAGPFHKAMREGKYTDGIWKELTGKTVEELGREWQKSLAK